MICTALLLSLPAAALLWLAGQSGLFTGPLPAGLGLRGGRLPPPSPRGNSVSSQAAPDGGAQDARIAPLAFDREDDGDGAAALTRLATLLLKQPGARLLQSGPDYLYAQFRSRWLGRVDDVEFALAGDAPVIHLRAAARGRCPDFGANRRRIEALRALFSYQRCESPR